MCDDKDLAKTTRLLPLLRMYQAVLHMPLLLREVRRRERMSVPALRAIRIPVRVVREARRYPYGCLQQVRSNERDNHEHAAASASEAPTREEVVMGFRAGIGFGAGPVRVGYYVGGRRRSRRRVARRPGGAPVWYSHVLLLAIILTFGGFAYPALELIAIPLLIVMLVVLIKHVRRRRRA